jgi:Trk K+ transport system NAD-binding subunit
MRTWRAGAVGPDGWRAMAQRRRPSSHSRRRVVICGDDPLAHRVVSELTMRYPVDVTVLLASRKENHGPRIAAVSGVRVVESETLDHAALRAAGVETAHAVAILHQDDVGNIHTALRAQELNPGVRTVIRMFNTSLGQVVAQKLTDCSVLSDASMAAPTFAAAAFGEVAPTHVRLSGRTLFVARRTDVRPQQVLCGLADTVSEPDSPIMLPQQEGNADIVLAVADGTPAEPRRGNRWRRIRQRYTRMPSVAFAVIRALAGRRLWRAALAMFIILIGGSAALALGERKSIWEGTYQTLLNALGNGNGADENAPTYVQIATLVISLLGVALIPLITAAVVQTVVSGRWDALAARGYYRHVIVIGLGNLGTRVIQRLHDLGVPVVAIDKQRDPRGAQVTGKLNIPLVIGDAGRPETLATAGVRSARAVLALSTDDDVNLEAGLYARTANPDVRVVLRLFDGDFAELVQASFGPMTSRSVSFVAAPAFAAAIMEREVVGTISVERRILLVAQVPVAAGSTLDGATVRDARVPGELTVLAVTPQAQRSTGARHVIWSPRDAQRISAGDTLQVITTRGGFSRILTDAGK